MRLSNLVYHPSAGETFDSAAHAIYGDSNFAPELLSANPESCHLTAFRGGETLRVPVVSAVRSEDTDNYYAPVKAPWRD